MRARLRWRFAALVFHAVNVIMDSLLPAGDFGPVFQWGLLLAALYLVQYAMQRVVEYWGHIVGVRIEHDMRRDLFRACASAAVFPTLTT